MTKPIAHTMGGFASTTLAPSTFEPAVMRCGSCKFFTRHLTRMAPDGWKCCAKHIVDRSPYASPCPDWEQKA